MGCKRCIRNDIQNIEKLYEIKMDSAIEYYMGEIVMFLQDDFKYGICRFKIKINDYTFGSRNIRKIKAF